MFLRIFHNNVLLTLVYKKISFPLLISSSSLEHQILEIERRQNINTYKSYKLGRLIGQAVKDLDCQARFLGLIPDLQIRCDQHDPLFWTYAPSLYL